MTDTKKKAIAVTSKDLWLRLKELGVTIPDNCADIIIEARVGDVVRIYYRCYADKEATEAAASIMFRVDSELADAPRTTYERVQAMFAAYWKVAGDRSDIGPGEAWKNLTEEQKGGWYQAVMA